MLPGFSQWEDTAKLLSVTENIKHRLILQLIYSAGLRLGELTRFKVRDIHRDNGHNRTKMYQGKRIESSLRPGRYPINTTIPFDI